MLYEVITTSKNTSDPAGTQLVNAENSRNASSSLSAFNGPILKPCAQGRMHPYPTMRESSMIASAWEF